MMPATFFLLWTSLLCVDSLRAVIATSGAGGAPATARCAAPFDAPPVDSIDELLGGNVDLLDSAQRSLVESLLRVGGQRSLFEAWPAKGSEDASKMELVASLQKVDASYEGGLAAYVSKARVLLDESASGANPFSGYTAEVPDGETLAYGSAAFDAAEARGLDAAQNVGFVLVAGGLGERLGFSGIKLALPCETSTGRSYLELYCAFLAAWGARSGVALPLAIMTSDDTHAATEALLKASGHFGLLASQITLLKQGKVAALRDAGRSSAAAATIAVDDGGIPLSKPHGHGDVHALLHSSGLAEGWLQAGCRHVVFFQDTNALALHAVPAAVGAARLKALDVNTITVCRRAKQAQGAVVSLKHADGRTAVANVEYNQLEPMLRAQGLEGDAADEKTGLSPFPGNTNCFVAALPAYAETLRSTQGAVPEFVNAKYADAERSDFVKPARMECMMQDFSRTLPPDKRVGFTTLPQWLSYSPVKNDSDAAAAAARGGALPACAASGEADLYFAHAELLRLVGCTVARAPPRATAAGVEVSLGPQIVIDPSFATCFEDLRAKFPQPSKVNITARSRLVLRGSDLTIRALDLDGSLVLDATRGALAVELLRCRNQGVQVVAAAADASASAAEAQDETDAAAADDDASQDTAAPDDDDVVRAPPPLDDVLEAWARAQWPDPRLDDSASVLQCLFGDARYSPDVAAAVRTELHAALFDSASTAKRFDADHDEEWDQDFEWEWIPGPPKLDKLELRHLGPEINDAEPEPSPSEPRRLPTFPLSDAAGPASPRVLNRDSSGARLDEFFRVEYFKKTQGAVLSHLEPIPTRM
mmetsp:Transcript_17208/g.58174  ORF Transcript_17208/g.58174 Transcript_17208/m.58174 type:complete len:820 (+) Transcript_17208:94-2553(+)